MKKVLFVLGDNELQATNGRLVYIARSLADRGYQVDIMGCTETVATYVSGIYKDNASVRVILAGSQMLPIEHTVSLVNTYVKLCYDMVIPHTDLKFYKVTAFDDFRGHLADFIFPGIDVTPYRAVLLPLPSVESPPLPETDIFLSTLCFHAKEKGIPLVGVQLFPLAQTPPVIMRSLDYLIVKDKRELLRLDEYRVDREKTFLLNYDKEVYYLDTTDDRYRDFTLESSISIPKNELAVLLINHHRLRFCVKEVLEVMGSLDIPRTLFFMKRKFVVRELTEEDVFKEFYLDDIKSFKFRTYVLDPDNKGAFIMLCDAIVSPAHLSTLDFAAEYGKLAVIYNPLSEENVHNEDIVCVNGKESLKKALLDLYARKQSCLGYADIFDRITGE